MTLSPRALVTAVGAFLAAAVIAFLAGQSIGSDSNPAAVVPTTAAVEPVLVAQQIAPDEDPIEFIEARAEQEAASREIASEIEAPLDSDSGGSGVGVGDPVPGPSEDPPVFDTEPEPEEPTTGPAGGGAPALDTFEDGCADGGDDCPDGVGGYVLAAIRAIPPLAGITYWEPGEDGFYVWTPTCPEIDVPAGAAYFGVASTRPLTVTLDYRAGRWTGSGYEVDGTFTYTTPDALEAAWDSWIADDTAPDDDPRSWIKQCFLIEDLPPRDDYMGFITYADKYDPSITATNRPFRVDFDVYLESGFLPGELRRPTFLLGNGIDELLIGVTARPDHRFVAVATEDTTPGSCDTGGDENTVLSDTSLLRSLPVSDSEIPPDRMADPEYPYLADHTRSLVHRIWLQEGTDYLVCLYWLEAGTSFDPAVVDIAEEVAVSTPEAYRPRILFHGLTELFGSVESGSLAIDNCGGFEFDIAPFTTETNSQLRDSPLQICEGDDHLTELDRGIRVRTVVLDTFDDGTWLSGGRWIRTDLECHADPCLLKMPELYRVPLPDVPTERRLCGTGFGGGCDGEIPMRAAGYAELEVQYIHVPGNGRTDWSIGEVDEFEDTPPPPVGLAPRLDLDFEYELIGHPSQGARATVTITADREITFNTSVRNSPDCGLGDFPEGGGSDEFATVHTFVLDSLCLGYRYDLTVTAYDRTREAVGTIIEFGREWGPDTTFDVPSVLLYHAISVDVNAPNEEGKRYTVFVRPVGVAVPHSAIPYGTSLGWSWPVGDRAVASANGWQMFGLDGQANACSGEMPGTLTVNARHRYALLTQDEITLTFVVDVHENLPLGGAVVGECAVGGLVRSHLLQATVTVEELLAGLTITDETGQIVFEIRATNWRRELVG